MQTDPRSNQRVFGRAALVTSAAALSLIFGSGVASHTAPVLAQSSGAALAGCTTGVEDMSVADVAEKVNPAVVTITNLVNASDIQSQTVPGAEDPSLIPGGDSEAQLPGAAEGEVPLGTGSGFIVDEAGHVVTNAHVVEGAADLMVAFEDGTEAKATLVGLDDLLDVAVIQLDLTDGAKVPGIACFGNSEELRPGDEVVAIGSALGEFTNTVTDGTVNAKGRTLSGGYGMSSLIQHDAEIWPGNSGGPLLNLKGQVVGINAAGVSDSQFSTAAADIGFAIDGNTAKEVVDSLITDGTVNRPFLGIQGEALPIGQQVTDVVAGSPAADAGMLPGDILTEVDGTPINRKNTLLDLLLTHDVGDTVTITYDRDGDVKTADITLGERPSGAS